MRMPLHEKERAERLAELEELATELDCEEPAMLDIVGRFADLLHHEGRVRAPRRKLQPLP